MLDLIVKNGRVVLRDRVETTSIGVKDGKIVRIAPTIDEEAKNVCDAAGCYVLPGMVDAHMHLSEPGRTEWEGYETGTKAMAAGGITSFVEMPLNNIPATTDVASLELKMSHAKDSCWVDYAPMGGLVPWNTADLIPMAKAGVASFKAFVATCGSDKPGDFKNVTDWELYRGMREIAKVDGLVVVHCENATITDELGREAMAAGKTLVSDYVATRPIFTEVEAVEEAKARGVDASFESCPHYLLLATEELDAIGPKAKCSPPIRDRKHRERLWELLAEGRIEMLVSDHSPCTIDLKSDPNAFKAWGGISAAQNCVDAMFDEAVLKRGISPVTLSLALSTNAARRFRLEGKGEIAVGFDADLVVIDPNRSYTLEAKDLLYKNPFSAYEGRRIDCRVRDTFVRGMAVWHLGEGILGEARGKRIEIHG